MRRPGKSGKAGHRGRGAALAIAVMLGTGGCGDSQEQAIRALDDAGIKFTVGEFVAAAARDDLAALRMFAAAGMGIDSPEGDGMTALMKASETGASGAVEWLLESGAKPDGGGKNGRTPLIAAAKGGHADVIRLLLRGGADPLAKDGDAWSALTLAAYKGNAAAVTALAPKSTELLDDALLVAAFDGNPEMIDLLLNSGAYVNARSPKGQTALMIAAMNGHDEAVRLLLHNGANRYALDEESMTAASLALANGQATVGEYLSQPHLFEEEFGPAEEWEIPGEGSGVLAELPTGAGVEAGTIGAATARGPSRVEGAEIRVDEKGGNDVVTLFRMRDYRERRLPVMLQEVGEETAAVRVLYGDETPVVVREGETIADTGLKVLEFEERFANSKHGKGSLVDVSRMVVEDPATGEKHLLVVGVPAKSSETYALMNLDDSGRAYEVRAQDRFSARGGDFSADFRVLDVRPTQVVIENTRTGESFTIQRSAATALHR